MTAADVSRAAAAMGRVKSERKAKTSAENGRRGQGGRRDYYFLSGEGQYGVWERRTTTIRWARAHARKLACGGDRWCRTFDVDDSGKFLRDIETGGLRDVPMHVE
jgi:hypothetical protein